MDQFIYASNDLLSVDDGDNDGFDTVTYLMALLAIENEHPGTLRHVVRTLALVNQGWVTRARVSDAELSLQAQRDFRSWLSDFQDGLNNAEEKLKEELL
jgi:hypothetical protein